MFACNPKEVLEVADVELGRLGLLRGDLTSQQDQGVAMEDEFVGEFHKDAVAQQQGNDLLRSNLVDWQRCQHVFQQRDLQTRVAKGAFDLCLRFSLFVAKNNTFADGMHYVAAELQLLL